MNTEQERSDFEAWYVTDCERHGFQITVEEVAGLRGPHGDYRERAALHGKWVGWQAGRADLQSQDREGIIKAARAAMNESFEVGDEYGSIGIPSDRAAYLSLLLDEYDHARRADGGGE